MILYGEDVPGSVSEWAHEVWPSLREAGPFRTRDLADRLTDDPRLREIVHSGVLELAQRIVLRLKVTGLIRSVPRGCSSLWEA